MSKESVNSTKTEPYGRQFSKASITCQNNLKGNIKIFFFRPILSKNRDWLKYIKSYKCTTNSNIKA